MLTDKKMSDICLDFVQINQPSFFIHFAYSNVSREIILQTLEELNLGIVGDITFKSTTNKKNEQGNSIVVHFDRWFRNDMSDKVRRKLISGKSIQINYTPKAYLQVIAFQPKNKAKLNEVQSITSKPTIRFNDDDDDGNIPTNKGKNYRNKNNHYSHPPANESRQREPKERTYKNSKSKYECQSLSPDVFDRNECNYNSTVILPPSRKIKTKMNVVESSDTDDDYSKPKNLTDSEILYGDL